MQRWHQLYRVGGILALDPYPRADTGLRRTATVTVAFVERLALNKPRPGLVTLALQGPTSYRDGYELVFRRRADRPNQTWQADQTEVDILIVGVNGKPDRPWLTTADDDHSRAICGYTVFTGAPSALNTALALRQAIWRKTDPTWAMCGIPDILHVDHGSDFTSHHLERTAIELHIRLIHSIVGRPQGRGKIERFFGTINTELLAALPGHVGPGSRKPET
jgi:putative transposase